MAISRRIDSNRLAVKVFFVVATLILIPVFLTGVVAYGTLEQQLRNSKSDQMRADAKSWTLEALQRIRALDQVMRSNVQIVVDSNGKYIPVEALNQFGLDRIEFMEINDVESAGLVLPRQFDATNWANVDADKRPVLAVGPVSESGGELIFIYPVPGADKLLAGFINSDYLWGTKEYFSYETWHCVVAGRRATVFCPGENGAAFSSALMEAAAYRQKNLLAPLSAGEQFVGEYWSIDTLQGIVLPRLTTGIFQPERIVNEAIIAYRFQLFPIVGIAVLIAAWASLVLIRRQLRPLKQLTGAASKIAEGDFLGTLRIDSRDEFGELGTAFNKMRENLGRQFDHQSALARFDQLIFESSELTPVITASILELQKLLPGWSCWLSLVDGNSSDGGRCYFVGSDGEICTADHAIAPKLIAKLAKSASGLKLDCSRNTCFLPYEGLETGIVRPLLSDGEIIGYVGLGSTTDNTLRRTALAAVGDFTTRLGLAIAGFRRDEQLYIQGHYDALTGLPNRQLFKQRLQSSVDQHLKDGQLGVLLFIDIDGFKVINDSEGHSAGDRVLALAGERLRECVDEDTLVSRLGGDEFTVVLVDVQDRAAIMQACSAMIGSLQQPFEVDGRTFFVDSSIGAALFPDDGDSVETLLRKADSAMYVAKADGGGKTAFYESAMGESIRRRARADRDLRNALLSGELDIHYQPQFDSRTRELAGAEALLRWAKASRHSLNTGEFIELAERSGFIIELGQWALQRACEDYIWFRDNGIELPSLAVNVSARQLKESDFIASVREIVDKYEIPKGTLQLEVTETVLMDERIQAIKIFNQLREAGFRIGIDDFGTGYSSLGYLRKFDFDTLKVDRAFVIDLPGDPNACAIAEAIISMGRSLGKKVIAEGVENRQQLDYLSRHECYLIQGYLYSRPLDTHGFLQMANRFAGADTANCLRIFDDEATIVA